MGFAIPPAIEREFFRRLNAVVEPAVRFGVGSPRFAPAGLVVLETTGFKSGQKRRTPLSALKLGPYLLVMTARGERSFWVKNLRKRSQARYWRGGREHQARAFVLAPGKTFRAPKWMSARVAAAARRLNGLTRKGFAFAILAPLPDSGTNS